MAEEGQAWKNQAYRKYTAEFYRDNPDGTPLSFGAWQKKMRKEGLLKRLNPND